MELPSFLTPSWDASVDAGHKEPPPGHDGGGFRTPPQADVRPPRQDLGPSGQPRQWSKQLHGLEVPKQLRTFWCWAAAAAGVAAYCLGDKAPTQHEIATDSLRKAGKLGPGAPLSTDPYAADGCNVPLRIRIPLEILELLGDVTNDYLQYYQVVDEINKDRPLICYIRLVDTTLPIEQRIDGGHFVVVWGYRINDGDRYLYVQDPIDNSTGCSPRALRLKEMFDYRDDGGEWRGTYRISVTGPVPGTRDAGVAAVRGSQEMASRAEGES